MADSPMKPKPGAGGIVTKGGRKINIVNALSDLGLVTTELKSSLANSKEFVSDELANDGVKKVIMKQVRLVERASEFISSKVAYVTSQTTLSSVTNRQESRKRAATNYDTKIESKLKKK